jgi:hypothetical protein
MANQLDRNRHGWHNTPYKRYEHGGVGAPVGLTVFKTAEGSLGAVPGGFDSHTPLPFCLRCNLRISALLRNEMSFHVNSEKNKQFDHNFPGSICRFHTKLDFIH